MDKSASELLRQIQEVQSFLLGNKWEKDGMDFFRVLAEYLAKTLSVDYVCIDKLLPESFEAQTVAIYFDGHFEDNQSYKLEDTPCSKVQGPEVCFFPKAVRHLFPKDAVLQDMQAESYSGITLWAADGRPIGLIAVIGRKPLEDKSLTELILKQVSIRAAAEMEFLEAREKLEYYETLVETVSEAIISTDEHFRVNSWNKAAERMYGWKEDEVMGVDVSTIFHNQYPPDSSREKAIKILVEEGFWKDEVIQSRKDGTTINVSSSVTTIKNKSGKIIGIVAINRDITEKIRAREELQNANARLELLIRERTKKLQQTNRLLKKEIDDRIDKEISLKIAEEKYRTVADYTYDWETWYDPDGELLYISPSCYKITGYSTEDFLNDKDLLLKITHPDDHELVRTHFYNISEEMARECSLDFRIIARTGGVRWIGHSCQAVFNDEGAWFGRRGSNRDITAQKITEQVLLNSQRNLRALTQRIDAIAEEERRTISREIHDELGHMLTAMKFDLEGIINTKGLQKELINSLGESLQMVNSMTESVRKIATELRPGILEHLGLFPAIEWQLRLFGKRTRICCKYSPPEVELDFSRTETNIIYRVVQEVLTNIVRHANATHVKVTAKQEGHHFFLIINDNGVGFDFDGVQESGSLGILGMRERAMSIGGDIHIESAKDRGTTVTFSMKKN